MALENCCPFREMRPCEKKCALYEEEYETCILAVGMFNLIQNYEIQNYDFEKLENPINKIKE